MRRLIVFASVTVMLTLGLGWTAPASANAHECTWKVITSDVQYNICITVTGVKLNVSQIEGSYGGPPLKPRMELYINGDLRASHKATQNYTTWYTYYPNFNGNYPNGTTMKICARDLLFSSGVCSPTITIHN